MNLKYYYDLKNKDKKSLRAQGGLTYEMIGLKTKPAMTAPEVHYAVNKSWRVTFEKYKAVAQVLGMPLLEAMDEWAMSKAEHAKELAAKQMPARITSGRTPRR